MNHLIDVSHEGPYAAATSCFPITGNKETRTAYCKGKRVFVADTPVGRRVVALVHLGRMRVKRKQTAEKRPGRLIAYWMDVVTGTLYQLKTGIAVSSDELYLWGIHKDQSAIDALIARKFRMSDE